MAKKAITVAKNNSFDRLYQKLESKEGEKDVVKFGRAREKRTRDLENVICIQDDDGKFLAEETKIRERWRSYFSKLFNDEVRVYSQSMERAD